MILLGPLAVLAAAQIAVPLVTSLIQGGRAKKLGREVEKRNAAIPIVDPEQARYLADIRRKQKALEAGTDPMTAARMRGITQAGAQTQANIARNSGGSSAATVSGLLRAQNQINAGIQDAGAIASGRADQYQGMQGGVIQDMSHRRLNLLSYMRDQKAMEYAQARQGQQDNLMAAIGSIPDIGMGMAYDKMLSSGMARDAMAIPTRMDVRKPLWMPPTPGTPQSY